MYLLEIDKKTNLIVDDPTNDGWKCIKVFTDIIKDKKLGLEALSAVAIAVDYASPVRYYNEKDRPAKAMEIVTGNRKAFVWNQDLIQEACIVYRGLQYNPELEEKTILQNMVNNKLQEARESEDDAGRLNKMKEYRTIKKQLDEFEEKNKDKDLFEGAPTRDGYKLSRLETKMLNRKSFYYGKRQSRQEQERENAKKQRAKKPKSKGAKNK